MEVQQTGRGYGAVIKPATGFFAALLAVMTGCDNSPPVATNAPESGSLPSANQKSYPEINEEAVLGKVESESQFDAQVQLAKRLTSEIAEIREVAEKAEQEFRFADAVVSWTNAHERILKLYGPESWQSVDCRLAIQTATTESGFSPHQLDRLRGIASIQQQVAGSIQNGDFPGARRLADSVTAEVHQLFGEDSWMAVRQEVQLARLAELSGDFTRAIEGYQKSATGLLQFCGTVHPELESVHGYLAGCFSKTGDHNLAIANLKKAAELSMKIWGQDSLNFATRANELGVEYNAIGDFSTAMRVLNASEEVRVSVLGERHPAVAHSRLNRSIAASGMKDFAAAVELADLAEAALPDGQKEPGLLVGILRQKSAVLVMAREFNRAETELRRLVAIGEFVQHTDAGASLAEYQYRLAYCLAAMNRLDESVVELQKSLAIRSRSSGGNSTEAIRTRNLLASVLEKQGNLARADEIRGSIAPASFNSPAGNKDASRGD